MNVTHKSIGLVEKAAMVFGVETEIKRRKLYAYGNCREASKLFIWVIVGLGVRNNKATN